MDERTTAARAYLSAHHPFDQLPAEVLSSLANGVEQRRFNSGVTILEIGAPNDMLYLIHTGAVEVIGQDGTLIAKLGEGDLFGHQSLLADGLSDASFRSIEDTGCYCLSERQFREIYEGYPQFQFFLAPLAPGQLRGAAQKRQPLDSDSVSLLTIRTSDIVSRDLVAIPPTATVREAAELMTREGVSSLLVMAGKRLQGIVTDRDLRSRFLAKGMSGDCIVRDIMTTDPIRLDVNRLAYDALLTMARSGIHHLPLMDGETVVGMITDTDLVRRFSTSPMYIVGEIYQCGDIDALAKVSERLPQLLVTLVNANASARNIGRVISDIGEAINARLLELAEQHLGNPPISYAWLTGGSLARKEQTAHSDQDNALLLSDEYDAAQHGTYFESLARFVCDGLNACGYVYCPGEVMAVNPTWRQPLRVWKTYFDKWVEQPEPKALMHTCIFFDLYRVFGNNELFWELQHYLVEKARHNKLFHAYMASNALQFQPPLGFFRNFVLVKDGEHNHTLDLKLSGVVPITNVARVYALANGIVPINTQDRLEAAEELRALSHNGASNLIDAFEFISTTRLRHQARQIRDGIEPNNFVPPGELSQIERKHLKDAFSAVRTIQSALAQRYQTAVFG
ncbi:MAG: DUF294 nucleotidyltransferase-like domain-containing protein [Gammaproteobacteria bacterium]|nr:DUF294 nucleotidyltransferase-like domain-containing protein [Gammaproteobacteria bacterium]